MKVNQHITQRNRTARKHAEIVLVCFSLKMSASGLPKVARVNSLCESACPRSIAFASAMISVEPHLGHLFELFIIEMRRSLTRVTAAGNARRLQTATAVLK